jgi:hypothetical protein
MTLLEDLIKDIADPRLRDSGLGASGSRAAFG